MATDARIAVGLPAHPKTKKLIKRHGQEAAWNLICLFLWTASNRPDGSLEGMSAEDVELAADWCGDDGAFVKALLDVKFLDGSEGEYVLHDWAEHNPWAAGSDARSAKAKWNAAKRHHGIAEADRLVPEYAAIRNASSNAAKDATSNEAAEGEQQRSNAPSPSPSPSPSPNSVTDVTASEAGKSAEQLTKAELWSAGKSLLEQSGMPVKQCGTFVGKLVKDYGDTVVIDAVRAAVVARPADPAEYLKATCQHTAGQRTQPNRQVAIEQRNQAAVDAWLSQDQGAVHA